MRLIATKTTRPDRIETAFSVRPGFDAAEEAGRAFADSGKPVLSLGDRPFATVYDDQWLQGMYRKDQVVESLIDMIPLGVGRLGASLDGKEIGLPAAEWYRRFFCAIHDAGGTVERIVMDYESQPGCPQSDDPRIPAYWPKIALRNTQGWGNRPACIAWMTAVAKLLARRMREVIVDGAKAWLGYTPRITNYEGIARQTFPIFDWNGWPRINAAVGTESSPALYLAPGGRHHVNSFGNARTLPPIWNCFLDAINVVRSCGPSCAPWISHSTFGGNPKLWRELIRHLVAQGVRTILLWNWSDGAEQEDGALVEAIDSAKAGSWRSRPEIPLDTPVVTTGSVTTNVAEII